MKDSEFEIYHGDTLTNDWDMLREPNPAKKPANISAFLKSAEFAVPMRRGWLRG